MSGPPTRHDVGRTAAATNARRIAGARRLAQELTQRIALLDTPAIAALTLVAIDEIRRRKSVNGTAGQVDGNCDTDAPMETQQ